MGDEVVAVAMIDPLVQHAEIPGLTVTATACATRTLARAASQRERVGCRRLWGPRVDPQRSGFSRSRRGRNRSLEEEVAREEETDPEWIHGPFRLLSEGLLRLS